MRRVMFAIVLACLGVVGSVGVRGERAAAPGQASSGAAKPGGVPACDPGNGGLTLPPGFCALVVHEGGIGEGRPSSVHDAGQSAIYRLRWHDTPDYHKNPGSFRGFFEREGNRTDIPNQYFDVLLPSEPLSVIKVAPHRRRRFRGSTEPHGLPARVRAQRPTSRFFLRLSGSTHGVSTWGITKKREVGRYPSLSCRADTWGTTDSIIHAARDDGPTGLLLPPSRKKRRARLCNWADWFPP